jgi:hypothetical protein
LGVPILFGRFSMYAKITGLIIVIVLIVIVVQSFEREKQRAVDEAVRIEHCEGLNREAPSMAIECDTPEP